MLILHNSLSNALWCSKLAGTTLLIITSGKSLCGDNTLLLQIIPFSYSQTKANEVRYFKEENKNLEN